MYENITPDEHHAQVAALNHEICRLSIKLDAQEEAFRLSQKIDCKNPFANPTEYSDYNGDYRDIVPQIDIPGCVIPVQPHEGEKKRLKKFYSIGGSCILFHFIFAVAMASLLTGLAMFILQLQNPDASYYSLYDYAYSSSILISINAFTYLIANVLFSVIGMKRAKIRRTSLLAKTRNFGFPDALKYCFIAIFIQYGAAVFSIISSDILSKYGFNAMIDTSDMASTAMGTVVLILYQCVVAPITEELFYRGMVLKTFSRANQRFAIVASSVFFGLAHGNIPQFMLAFLLGMFLAHIDIKHNSILPSVIVHFFINTTAMILNKISQYGNSLTVYISELIYLAIAAAGLVLFICFVRKNMIPRTTPQQSRRGFAVAKTSLMVIAAFTALLGNTIISVLSTKGTL